ncbi:MAG: helix-turn-helix transcriptional regulator [Chloroflexi bacterium]|nr:MAG: helix-turn-helix transcriptional regulator [Chloroflexota bacterium]
MPEQPTPTPVAPSPEEAQRVDPLGSAVAEAVAKLRRSAGLSERAAARRLGTSQTQLRRMEDPRYLPSLRSLARVAAAYGYRLSVEFQAQDAPKTSGGSAPRPPKRAGGDKKRAPVTRSVSPSRGRRAAPGRARGGARVRRQAAAPRRRS